MEIILCSIEFIIHEIIYKSKLRIFRYYYNMFIIQKILIIYLYVIHIY